MINFKELWVLGHRIKPVLSSGDFDIVEGESEYGVAGLPLHSHSKYSEFFYLMEGELLFQLDQTEVLVKQGESLDIPVNIRHSFKNPSPKTSRWLNIHSPKGYMLFYTDMGISSDQEMSKENSLSEASITKLLSRATYYDMHLDKPDSELTAEM